MPLADGVAFKRDGAVRTPEDDGRTWLSAKESVSSGAVDCGAERLVSVARHMDMDSMDRICRRGHAALVVLG